MIPESRFSLRERVAVVTGASSGIGEVLAEGLAAAGARLVVTARRRERLEALATRLDASGEAVLPLPCDLSCEAEIDALVTRTLERFGRVDVLVNNAGLTRVQPVEEETLATFRAVLDVNLVGAFACAQRFGRSMLEARKGSIVNVASVLGLVAAGQIPQAGYVASKAGLVNLTRELAAQWARRGVRVNALAPGWFPSEMTDDMFRDERGERWIRQRTPMGRPGRLEELVGPCVFLASDASSYVTGQVLVVDGGWTIV